MNPIEISTVQTTIDGKLYQEIQVPWSEATDEERTRWACYQQNHVKRLVEIKKEEGLH